MAGPYSAWHDGTTAIPVATSSLIIQPPPAGYLVVLTKIIINSYYGGTAAVHKFDLKFATSDNNATIAGTTPTFYAGSNLAGNVAAANAPQLTVLDFGSGPMGGGLRIWPDAFVLNSDGVTPSPIKLYTNAVANIAKITGFMSWYYDRE